MLRVRQNRCETHDLRGQQVCDAGTDTIVTGCAYCLHMLEDSLKLLDRDDTNRVVDLGSLMPESLEDPRLVSADYNGRSDDVILSVTRVPICLAHSAVLFLVWSEYRYVRLSKPIEPP